MKRSEIEKKRSEIKKKRSEIEKLLPMVMQRTAQDGSILGVILEIMAQMHAPIEEILQNSDQFFDPRRTGEAFLPMLAHWLNLTYLFEPNKVGTAPRHWQERTLPTEAGYLRELIATAVKLAKLRGTRYGLEQMLQTATGLTGVKVEEGQTDSGDTLPPFHIRVTIPSSAEKYKELIKRIVAHEKPAHITDELITVDS
ncbi:MAG: phage tail protein [Candidatus Electrothrix scaldis]|nr:MAG: phage tail protein [Candidatus Electrothrix sp. GW3-3]